MSEWFKAMTITLLSLVIAGFISAVIAMGLTHSASQVDWISCLIGATFGATFVGCLVFCYTD